jgi:hypothetical protein
MITARSALHELVEVYGGGGPGPGARRQQQRVACMRAFVAPENEKYWMGSQWLGDCGGVID